MAEVPRAQGIADRSLERHQRLGKVLVERPRELVAAMPRQRSHQRNPVECCVNAHAGHPVCSSAIATVPALDMRHTVRRRRVPTGTKLNRQCAMANILKGRGRAVPAKGRALHRILMSDCAGTAIQRTALI